MTDDVRCNEGKILSRENMKSEEGGANNYCFRSNDQERRVFCLAPGAGGWGCFK